MYIIHPLHLSTYMTMLLFGVYALNLGYLKWIVLTSVLNTILIFSTSDIVYSIPHSIKCQAHGIHSFSIILPVATFLPQYI